MKERPFILFLEDVAEDFILANRALGESGLAFDAKQVETKEAFSNELQEHPPDLILSDHGLQNFDSFSALALTKEKAPDVPFIFFTGSLGDEVAVRALKSGAAGYVAKHRLAELAPAVSQALRLAGERARHAADLKAAEDKIRQLNNQWEQRLAQRTSQLEAVNNELETFSYSISHDLRAPLRHIDGFVDLLRKSASPELDSEDREFLRIIAESAQQMGKLLDVLRAFSRTVRAPMHRTQVNMASLLRAVREDLQPEMEGRQIEWVIGHLPEVSGDPALLRQVLLNLLSNALKYSRSRPVARLEIGSTFTGQETVFFVRDNGIGFDMQYASRLFGIFQRFHASPEFEGVGIGLATVRRIIQRHDGRTWAEAATGQGAAFYFSLPKPEPDDGDLCPS